jgi:hypothetical protein
MDLGEQEKEKEKEGGGGLWCQLICFATKSNLLLTFQ